MRFLVDVCVGASVHHWLKEQGHDSTTVAGRDPKMSDSDILDWAFREKRVLVTLDKDFQKLAFALWKPHSGIIRLPNVGRMRRVELIGIVVERHAEDLLSDAIVTVKPGKIRVTRMSRPGGLL